MTIVGDESRDEWVDGVRLHHYSAFTQLTLDHGAGGDWAGCGMIECFANIADTITLMVEGVEGGSANEGDDEGYACVALTPAEARWLGRWLCTQADTAEQQAAARPTPGAGT